MNKLRNILALNLLFILTPLSGDQNNITDNEKRLSGLIEGGE